MDNDDNLKEVLHALQKKCLTLKLSKCKLCKQEVEYLGHTIPEIIIKPKHCHVSAIMDVTKLMTKEQFVAVLGLNEMYSKFIQEYGLDYDLGGWDTPSQT